jgi:hypothetical protein
MDFASAKYDVADAFAANELYQDNGWTDGLPIEPPTDALLYQGVSFLNGTPTYGPDGDFPDGNTRTNPLGS